MFDPYQSLGVSKTATAHEIKSAYRKLAKKLHPDVNPGRKDIEQKFKEITAAYDLLSDPEKRAQYDRGTIDAHGQTRGFGGESPFAGAWTRRGPSAGGGHTSSGGAGGDPFAAFGGMEDIFAEFMGMGGGAKRQGARSPRNKGEGDPASFRGSDVTYTTSVSFIEACLGGKKRVTLANDKTIDITIPAGVEDGHKLRLKGQGLPGIGGSPGDAIVELKVASHPSFSRKDKDIFLELPISLPEAVLGGSVAVSTLDGQVTLKIPKGANSGTSLRLKGKGVATSPSGDMFVKLKVILPDPVPQDLLDFVEKWAKKNAYDPRKKQ